MSSSPLTKKSSLLTYVCSTFAVTIIGSIPWMLFSQRTVLALVAPSALLAVFVLNDRLQNYESKLFRQVSLLATLVFVQIILIHFSVIPEASPNYRTLFRASLISIIPLVFLITQKRKVRRVIAANFLVLLVGLLVVEGALTIFSPKKDEQNKWSSLASQFTEAPIPKKNPVLSMEGQYRITTNQPETISQRILFYGGSTTFNREVSDSQTYASLTQSLLNKEANGIIVENRGTIGASAIDLWRFLQTDESAAAASSKTNQTKGSHRGDIVVFYIGVNEAKNAIFYRDPITRLSLQFQTFETATNWVFKHTNIGYSLNNLLAIGKSSVDENNLAETMAALESAQSFVTERGGIFIPVIQPHVFTRSNPLPYEQAIRTQMGEFPDAIDSVYPRLADLVLSFENSADARKIFDKLKSSPYFDWCHVNEIGNKYIAEFMYEVIKPFIIGEN